jgi:4-carboxymuconolactone decarboxylase
MAEKPVSAASTSALARRTPRLAEYTNEVLFGDLWERPELSKRDRSLIVVSSLISLNRVEQLGFHLKRALENGVTREELSEVITHLAFYAGWPTSMSAVALLDKVLNEEGK